MYFIATQIVFDSLLKPIDERSVVINFDFIKTVHFSKARFADDSEVSTMVLNGEQNEIDLIVGLTIREDSLKPLSLVNLIKNK